MYDRKRLYDDHGRPYTPGINCSKCGRFVGKDGDCGLSYDYEYGWDIYYPECAPCLSTRLPLGRG